MFTKEKILNFTGEELAEYVLSLHKEGTLSKVLPELSKLAGMPHSFRWHPEGDVFEHVLAALRVNKEKDILLNYSVLFHDLGKGITYKFRDGKHTYYGHDAAGIPLIKNVCERFNIKEFEEAIIFCADNHMRFHKILEMRETKVLELMKSKYFDLLTKVSFCDDSCRLHAFSQDEWNRKINRIEMLRKTL